jgi:hypothetical protein
LAEYVGVEVEGSRAERVWEKEKARIMEQLR